MENLWWSLNQPAPFDRHSWHICPSEKEKESFDQPAQAIAIPSRNINPFHAIIEHKRAVKCRVRLNLWDVGKKQKEEAQPPTPSARYRKGAVLWDKKNRKQVPIAIMQKKKV